MSTTATLPRPSRAELQVAVLECVILAVACAASYWLVTTTDGMTMISFENCANVPTRRMPLT